MPRRYATQAVVDDAVRQALSKNSSSSVMYLFRERMIREIVETVTPIIAKPFMERIAELERQLGKRPTVEPEKLPEVEAPPVRPPKEVSNHDLAKLKEALDAMEHSLEDDS